MTSNYGSGFTGFQTAIAEVTEALGGNHTREAVARLFDATLTRVIHNREGERFPSFSSVNYTKATEQDFDKAHEETLFYLCRLRDPVEASADWKGARFEHRGDSIVLTGGGYSLMVALLASFPEYDYRVRDRVTKWRTFLTDDGERLLTSMSSRPTATNQKSEVAAHKSLRRLVETFFTVKFKEAK